MKCSRDDEPEEKFATENPDHELAVVSRGSTRHREGVEALDAVW